MVSSLHGLVPESPQHNTAQPRVAEKGPDAVLEPISALQLIVPAKVKLRHHYLQTRLGQSVYPSLQQRKKVK